MKQEKQVKEEMKGQKMLKKTQKTMGARKNEKRGVVDQDSQ